MKSPTSTVLVALFVGLASAATADAPNAAPTTISGEVGH